MPRPAPLPSPLDVRPFSVAQAKVLGVPPQRLRRADLTSSYHGARAGVVPITLEDHALALHPLLGEHERFSHLTAAELHGMRLPEGRRSRAVHVTSAHAWRGRRRPGVIGHKSGLGADVTVLASGLRTSSPVLAWCECASLLAVADLVVMGDGLVSRKHPLATLAELRAAVDAWPGRRGAARLRAAMEGIRAGTDSARETVLRRMLLAAGLPEPEVNMPVVTRNGTVIAHGDLGWPQQGVILEYEGRQHWEDARQFTIDIDRHHRIAEQGFRIIRVDTHLLAAAPRLLAVVRRALGDAGRSP